MTPTEIYLKLFGEPYLKAMQRLLDLDMPARRDTLSKSFRDDATRWANAFHVASCNLEKTDQLLQLQQAYPVESQFFLHVLYDEISEEETELPEDVEKAIRIVETIYYNKYNTSDVPTYDSNEIVKVLLASESEKQLLAKIETEFTTAEDNKVYDKMAYFDYLLFQHNLTLTRESHKVVTISGVDCDGCALRESSCSPATLSKNPVLSQWMQAGGASKFVSTSSRQFPGTDAMNSMQNNSHLSIDIFNHLAENANTPYDPMLLADELSNIDKGATVDAIEALNRKVRTPPITLDKGATIGGLQLESNPIGDVVDIHKFMIAYHIAHHLVADHLQILSANDQVHIPIADNECRLLTELKCLIDTHPEFFPNNVVFSFWDHAKQAECQSDAVIYVELHKATHEATAGASTMQYLGRSRGTGYFNPDYRKTLQALAKYTQTHCSLDTGYRLRAQHLKAFKAQAHIVTTESSRKIAKGTAVLATHFGMLGNPFHTPPDSPEEEQTKSSLSSTRHKNSGIRK